MSNRMNEDKNSDQNRSASSDRDKNQAGKGTQLPSEEKNQTSNRKMEGDDGEESEVGSQGVQPRREQDSKSNQDQNSRR